MKPKKQHLKKRKDGRYVCKLGDEWFYGKTEDEALQKRQERMDELKDNTSKPKEIKFSEYSERWLKAYKSHLTPRPYETHKRNIKKWIERMGDRNLTEYLPSDVSLFYQQDKDKSFSYLHSLQHTIKSIFNSAFLDGFLKSTPLITVFPLKSHKGTHREITKDERTAIHSLEHRLRPAVMVMLYAGLRRGEALALDIDRDVDFLNKTVTVRSAVRFNNKGLPEIVPPKTQAGNRKVPLLDILYSELQNKHGLLCPSAKNTLMSETAWNRAWESYLLHLNKIVKSDLRPHDLRHSYCTMLYDMDIDVKSTMSYMGHADSSTTMQIYTHLSETRKMEAENILREKEKIYLSSQIGSH